MTDLPFSHTYNPFLIKTFLNQTQKSYLFFDISASPEICKKYNLYLSNNNEINFKIECLKSLEDLFLVILNKFGINVNLQNANANSPNSSIDGFGVRLNGYDEFLIYEKDRNNDRILVNFENFFKCYRSKSVITLLFDQVGSNQAETKTTEPTQTSITFPTFKTFTQIKNSSVLLKPLFKNFQDLTIDNLSDIRQMSNAVSGICSRIELVNSRKLLKEIEYEIEAESQAEAEKKTEADHQTTQTTSSQSEQFLKSLILEQGRLIKMYEEAIDDYCGVKYFNVDRFLTTKYELQSPQSEIPLYLKVESLHSIPSELINKHFQLLITLQKSRFNTFRFFNKHSYVI